MNITKKVAVFAALVAGLIGVTPIPAQAAMSRGEPHIVRGCDGVVVKLGTPEGTLWDKAVVSVLNDWNSVRKSNWPKFSRVDRLENDGKIAVELADVDFGPCTLDIDARPNIFYPDGTGQPGYANYTVTSGCDDGDGTQTDCHMDEYGVMLNATCDDPAGCNDGGTGRTAEQMQADGTFKWIALHEILHTFGLAHNDDPRCDSIMGPCRPIPESTGYFLRAEEQSSLNSLYDH